MRVIGGAFKRRKLQFKKSPSVRPMTDRMKETLFNILGEMIADTEVLDLFSGSGSIGIEAISRGARHVTFVDSDPESRQCIKKNLDGLDIADKGSVYLDEAEGCINWLKKQGKKFGILFLDPPYNKGFTKKILPQIDRFDILTPPALVIVHHAAQEALPVDDLTYLKLMRSEKIGQARLSFLVYKALTLEKS